MPKTRAVNANNGRSIKDFFKASPVPQRPKSSQPDDDIYEEIVVATACPRQQSSPLVSETVAGKETHTPRPFVSSALNESIQDGAISQPDRAPARLASSNSKTPAEPPMESIPSVGGSDSQNESQVGSRRVSLATAPPRLRSGNASIRPDKADSIEILSNSSSPPSSLDSAQFFTPQASQSPIERHDAPGASATNPAAISDSKSAITAQNDPFPVSHPTENVSFSSAISLSSVPVSTQSSSRRFVKDGIKGVTNSDSDDDAASDEELPDVWALLPAKRRKLSPPPERKEAAPRGLSATSSRSATTRQASSRVISVGPPQPPKRNYKYNLMNMAIKAKNRKMAADRIAELERSTGQDEPDVGNRPDLTEVQNMMTINTSDVDDQERIALALERTEALAEAQRFDYFLDSQPVYTNQPFPRFAEDSPNSEPWCAALKDDYSRDNAFTTGYVADTAMHFPLDPELASWIARQLLFEPNEPLCESYVETLHRAALTCGVPDELAKVRNFYHTRESSGSTSWRDGPATAPAGLEHVLRVVSFCAPAADETSGEPNMSVSAFIDFALINIDENVRMDFSIPMVIASCMENMLDCLPAEMFLKFKTEVTAVFHSIASLSRQLRCKAIASLTAGTQRTFEVRQLLATEFLAQISHSPLEGEPRPAVLALIARSLDTSPDFALRDTSDYQLLQALVAVLDIAIGAGITPYYLPDQSSSVVEAWHLSVIRSASQIEARKKHDEEVDGLTRRLRKMSNRIRGAGTTHLARTEAKSAIERLIVRLEYSVRSKPRPRKSAFGVSGDDTLGSLHRFLRPMGDGALALEDIPANGNDETNAEYESK